MRLASVSARCFMVLSGRSLHRQARIGTRISALFLALAEGHSTSEQHARFQHRVRQKPRHAFRIQSRVLDTEPAGTCTPLATLANHTDVHVETRSWPSN